MASADGSPHREALTTYIIASLPAWMIAVVLAILLPDVTAIGPWTAMLVALAWIGTDLAMFPRRRHYYTPEPASHRMVAKVGTAASALSPRGLVRVHGELWNAVSADPDVAIPAGAGVRVCNIHGLELVVEPRIRPGELRDAPYCVAQPIAEGFRSPGTGAEPGRRRDERTDHRLLHESGTAGSTPSSPSAESAGPNGSARCRT